MSCCFEVCCSFSRLRGGEERLPATGSRDNERPSAAPESWTRRAVPASRLFGTGYLRMRARNMQVAPHTGFTRAYPSSLPRLEGSSLGKQRGD